MHKYFKMSLYSFFSQRTVFRLGRSTRRLIGPQGQLDPCLCMLCMFVRRPDGRLENLAVDRAVDRLALVGSLLRSADRAIERRQLSVQIIELPIDQAADRSSGTTTITASF